MLKITRKIKKPEAEESDEDRTATRNAEKADRLKRGLEAHQEKALNEQIASAAEKVIEECKRVLNAGIRDYVTTQIEKGWSEKFSERVEKAARDFFNNHAEVNCFKLMPFVELKALVDQGWRVLDIVRCNTKEDGIWMQRFHRDRKEVKAEPKTEKQAVKSQKIKISIKRRA